MSAMACSMCMVSVPGVLDTFTPKNIWAWNKTLTGELKRGRTDLLRPIWDTMFTFRTKSQTSLIL